MSILKNPPWTQRQVDDPIDAFAVHGAAGAWGVLAAALFDWGNGVAPGARWRFLGRVWGEKNGSFMGKSMGKS